MVGGSTPNEKKKICFQTRKIRKERKRERESERGKDKRKTGPVGCMGVAAALPGGSLRDTLRDAQR